MSGSIPRRGRTDFSRYQHAQLVHMLFASDPAAVGAAGDTWAAVGRSLHDRATDVEQQLRDFQNMWTGGAAEQYKTMIGDLADGVRQVATTALTVRDLTYTAAEALRDARQRMPAAVDVPPIAQSTLALATTPLDLTAGLSAAEVNVVRVQQAQAISIVRDYQQAQATSDVAYGQAVQIMTDLSGQYATVEASMPQAPATAAFPTLVNGVPATQAPVLTQLSGTAVAAVPAARAPLFSGVFSSGLAAAAAALGGRFGTALPGLLGKASRNADKAMTDAAKPAVVQTSGGSAPHGGAGASLGKLTGVGGVPSVLAHPLTSSPVAPAVAGLATAVGAAAAGNPLTSGYMPMMPMGMAGAGDIGMDGGRRIPPWLVETEDVWGESSVIAPSVIGDEVDPARGGGHWPAR